MTSVIKKVMLLMPALFISSFSYAAVNIVNCPATVTCTKDNDMSSCTFDGDHAVWQLDPEIGTLPKHFQPPKGTYYFSGAHGIYHNGMNDWSANCYYINGTVGGDPQAYVIAPESSSAPHPYGAGDSYWWGDGSYCAAMADPEKCPFQVGNNK